MARGPANASGDDTESSSRPGKRRCVQSACVPCRKRKSKCDGGTPVCATCTAVYKTDCYYDEASETRRSKASASKRDTPSSSSQADTSDRDHADFLIKTLRTLPDTEAAELAKQISDPRVDLASLAETYRRSSVLPFSPASDKPSLESDLSLLMGKPSVTIKGETRLFGHSSNLGLVREDEDYNARPHVVPLSNTRYANGIWTSVTQDAQFIDDLLNLYFEWSHSFYVIFSRECFLRDFRSGRHKYCSPLLVNAILAYACHFSDDPRARTNPADPRTAGDHFFAEARQLLYEDETPSLTQTQALCIMAIREPSAGRDSSGFLYIGRCMRMAVELGMHLEVQTDTKSSHNLTPSEIEVRRVTFWGCFIVDAIWSLCIGRVAQLPKSAITVKVPTVEEATYDPPPDSFRRTLENPGQTSRMFMESFAKLAELINDNNYMFYAPKERTTSRRLLKMYREYKEWYNELPPRLHLPTNPNSSGKPMAHILVLHMFYHTVVLHLFRPFLKVEIIDSDIRPRDICIQKANEVSELLRLYRKHYDLRACTLVLTHILLSVSIVHLIFPQSTGNFVQSLKALEDMSVCHYFGARSYKIVHTLAKTWNLPWPEELQLSTIVPKEEASLDSGEPLFQTHTASPPQEMTSNGYTELAPPGAPERRESHSMFALEHQTPDAPSMPGNIQSPPIHFGEQQHRLIQQAQPGAPTFQFGTGNAVPLQAGAGSSSEHADMLFWTPAPGFGLPILPRDFSTGPMDLNNMLATTNEWDRFGRDGFKLSEDWNAQELAMGYGNTMSNPNMGMANNLGAHGTASGAEASAYAVSTNNVAYSDANATSTGVHSMAPSGPGFQSWEWNSGDNTAGSKFNRGGA